MAKKKNSKKNKLHIKKNVRDLDIFLVIITILGLVFMNWAFTLIMLLGVTFILWLSNFFSKKKKKKSNESSSRKWKRHMPWKFLYKLIADGERIGSKHIDTEGHSQQTKECPSFMLLNIILTVLSCRKAWKSDIIFIIPYFFIKKLGITIYICNFACRNIREICINLDNTHNEERHISYYP